jgi:hypothetical protein
LKYVIPAAIAIGVGIVTLIGYFIQTPEILAIRQILTGWAVVLGGLAVVVGLLNLIVVNFRRIQTSNKGAFYSLLTVAAAVGTFVVGSLDSLRAGGSPTLYQEGSLIQLVFNAIIIPSQAALAALVMIFLVIAAVKLMRNKPNRWSIIFLVGLVVVLVGWIPLNVLAPLNAFRDWAVNVPVSAGARGILIGVALGSVMIGLRVLTGIERPYKD